jgi:hypothetical protein
MIHLLCRASLAEPGVDASEAAAASGVEAEQTAQEKMVFLQLPDALPSYKNELLVHSSLTTATVSGCDAITQTVSATWKTALHCIAACYCRNISDDSEGYQCYRNFSPQHATRNGTSNPFKCRVFVSFEVTLVGELQLLQDTDDAGEAQPDLLTDVTFTNQMKQLGGWYLI